MTTRKAWKPDYTVHPGESVREAIAESGLTLRAFAVKLGIAQSYLSDICSGKRAVGPRMALRLERLGVGTAELWVHMQANHDLFIERARAGER